MVPQGVYPWLVETTRLYNKKSGMKRGNFKSVKIVNGMAVLLSVLAFRCMHSAQTLRHRKFMTTVRHAIGS